MCECVCLRGGLVGHSACVCVFAGGGGGGLCLCVCVVLCVCVCIRGPQTVASITCRQTYRKTDRQTKQCSPVAAIHINSLTVAPTCSGAEAAGKVGVRIVHWLIASLNKR